MGDSKTTNDPVESYLSAWPKSADDVSGHYVDYVDEVARLRAENTRLRLGIEGAIVNLRDAGRFALASALKHLLEGGV